MKSVLRSKLHILTAHQDEVIPRTASEYGGAPLFRVLFRNVVTGNRAAMEQIGWILNLSKTGCHVKASVPIQKGLLMELRIFVPDLVWPIMIDGGIVQSVKENVFCLHFIRLRPQEDERVAWVVARIADERGEENTRA